MKITKEGIAPYLMKIYEMRNQLQELGEVMSDREMKTVVLNALPEWGNFTSSIYAKKEATTLSEMWSQQKKPDLRQKNMWDQRSKHLLLGPKERVNLASLFHEEQTKDMSKIQGFGCQKYGHYKRNCPKLKKDNNNKRKREEAYLTQ